MHSTSDSASDSDTTDLSISRGHKVDRKMALSSRNDGRRLWRGFAFAAPVFLAFAMISATAFAQTFTIADASFDETSAPGTVSFTVSLSEDPGVNTYTVDYATSDATAADGSDYTAATGTLTFTSGITSLTVDVTVATDATDEVDETFVVDLSNATGGSSIGSSQATGTILDDDGPNITITDYTVTEAGTAEFYVQLSATSPQTITVDYATADVTAVATAGDYTAATATTLTFSSGQQNKIVYIVTGSDTTDEGVSGTVDSETFSVLLSNADNGTITSATGTGTITDDDEPPTVSVTADGAATASETDGTATADFTFTVALAAASEKDITVTYFVNDGTATTADADYVDHDDNATATSLAFAAGDTSKTVTVVVNGDDTDENSEAFTVDIDSATTDLGSSVDSAPVVSSSQATGTVTNDDSPPDITVATPTSVDDDGTNLTFTVSMSNPSSASVTVDYATSDDTATTADSDYTSNSGTLTWAAGDSSDQTVTVLVTSDTKYEVDEAVTFTLSNRTGGVSGDSTINSTTTQAVSGTITNSDSVPTVSVTDYAENESNDGTFEFTTALSNASYQAITVDYDTTDGTATTADSDYTAVVSGGLTFSAGNTTPDAALSVTVGGDLKNEDDETFTVTLSNPANATLDSSNTLSNTSGTNSTATGTVTNDDGVPTVSIADVTEDENNDGTISLVVSLTATSSDAVTVDYTTTTTAGSATAGVDFTAATGTLTIAAGDSSGTVDITVAGDTTNEDDETFVVTLSNADLNGTTLTITTDEGTGTIGNDDNVSLSIAAVSGNEDDGAITVTVSTANSVTSDTAIGFTVNTVDGTATTADSDYTAITADSSNEIAIGATSATFSFTPTLDTTFEGDETVTIRLSSATGGADTGPIFTSTLDATGPEDATATITNDDTAPTVSIVDASAAETASDVQFTVSLSAASDVDVTVAYATTAGTGTASTDYTTTSGTLTISASATTGTIDVPILADALYEADETFTLTLSSPTNSTLDTSNNGNTSTDASIATGTITNDDAVPTIAIDDVASGEADGTAVYTLTLSAVSGLDATVAYAVTSGTATAGTDTGAATDDDSSTSDGTATFTAGDTEVVVTVVITDDAIDEVVAAPEAYTIALSGATNATTSDTGAGTITDNDATPTISIDDVTQAEDTEPFTFTITLSAESDEVVTVDYAINNGTASSGDSDFSTTLVDNDSSTGDGTATFPAGTTTVTVAVSGTTDTKDESDTETFTIDLTNVTSSVSSAVTIATAQGTGTITDDDASPTISINDVTTTNESDTAVFTISLSGSSGQTITVDYAINDATATVLGLDYSGTLVDDDSTTGDGTATFTAGDTEVTVTVTTNEDAADEVNETFTIDLTNAANATISGAQGTGTITDDDVTPTISVDDVTVTEGDTSGTTSAVFTITLSAPSGNDVTVNYSVSDGTATTSDSDFSSALTDDDASTSDGVATFAAAVNDDPANGDTTVQVTVLVNKDDTDEATETYSLNLSSASDATISGSTGTGTITTDDTAPTIAVDNITITEGASGTTTGDFTVSLSNASDTAVGVTYALADNVAAAASDYSSTGAESDASSGDSTVTFAAGETSHTVTVTVNGDVVNEADEIFNIDLTSPTGGNNGSASISDAQGDATINNDDTVELSIAANSGNESSGTFTLTVTATNPTDTAITFDVDTVDGTATTANSDYTAISTVQHTIAGDSSATTTTVTVTPTADTINEDDETVTISLSNLAGGADSAVTFAATSDTTGPETATATLTNDDVLALEIGDDTSTNETDGTMTFTVILASGGTMTSDADVTVNYSTADVTANDGVGDSGTGVTDYTTDGSDDDGGTVGTLTIEAGTASGVITVAFADDSINEADETFSVVLDTVGGGSGTGNGITTATGTGTITDDDSVEFSVDDVTVTEASTATFTISVDNASDADMTVTYTTQDGVATTANSDYTAATGTAVVLAAGSTSMTVDVVTTGDLINEDDETYSMFIASVGGGNSANNNTVASTGGTTDNTGAGIITDDDDVLLSIDDVTVNEEDGTATFTVTSSSPTDNAVTVDYDTASGTATDGTDYTNITGGTATILGDSSDTTFTFTVSITDEATFEADETYTVTLDTLTVAGGNDGTANQVALDTTNPGNISGDASVGTGTITNTDAAPVITVAAGSGTEAGNIDFVVSIDKAPTSGLDAVVTYAAADSTVASATSATDYSTTETDDDGNADSGTLTFTSAGAGGDLTISVPSTADTIDENNETFTLTLLGAGLSNATFTGASVADITETGTITDDDDAPQFQITDVAVTEGTDATVVFTIDITAVNGTTASALVPTVDYVVADGTATAASESDYTSGSVVDNDAATTDGVATFADESTTSVTVTVPLVDESTDESAETFTVTIGGVTLTNASVDATNAPTNAVSGAVATATITDDDNTPTVTVADITVAENAGTTMDFVITLSNASELVPSIDWKLTDVTTTSGTDYTATSANAVTFSETETSKTISVTVTNDTIDETASETFTFEVDRNDANLSGGTIGSFDVVSTEATGTITDDEAAPTITVSDATFAEAAGATTYTGTEIFLSHGSDTDITVDYVVNDGSGSSTFNAVDTEDYTDTNGTLTFSAGTTVPAADLAITIGQDTKDENDEGFDIVFSNILGGVAASTETFAVDGTAAITITDDDAAPTVGIAAVTQAEAGGNAVFTATLTAISGKTVQVTIDTAAGDTNAATAGTDYTALSSSTITFGADSDQTKQFSVVVADDAIDEEDQEYKVVGSSFVNTSEAVTGDATAVGTITDDDAAPLVYVQDITQAETEASQTFDFAVTLDNTANGGSNPGVSEKAITVAYDTSAGDSEPATAGTDYTAASGTSVSIAAGVSSATAAITVAGDTTDEADQEFKVTLSGPTNATLDTNNDLANGSGADNIAVGTITDNDAAPTIAVDDITILEVTAGSAGTVTGDFSITISEASEFDVTVDVATSTTDATSGTDFDAVTTTTVTISAGDADNTEAVTVTVNGDDTDEANQTFNLDLTNATTTGSTPTISDATGVATITDEDAAPGISIDDITVLESAAGASGTVPGTFAVTLDAASEQIITVDFAAATGTTNGATVAADFATTSGTVTFSAGDQSEAVAVTVNGDTTDEEDQTVEVTLSNPASASGDTPALTVSVGTLTITDDDAAPNVSVQDASVTEGATGATASLTLTVVLDAVSEKSATVDYAIVDVTTATAGTLAAGGADYSATITESDADATAGTITFAIGETSHTAIATVSGDDTDEGTSETLTFTLSNPNANATLDTGNDHTNASGADNIATGTITDDDATPIITLADVTIVDEDNGASNSQTFAPTLDHPSSSTITANYTVAAGTASTTADFTAATGTIQFTAGNTAADADIAVTLTDDSVYEGDETFTVSLDTATNSVFSDTSDTTGPEVSTATITDDEAAPTISIGDITVAEGDSGTATFTFVVTASSPATQAITVVHTVTDGTAVDASTAGPGDGTDDFDFSAGTVTIPGDSSTTTATITVTANGDTFYEDDETFTVALSNALLNGVTSLTITDASGLGTITNEDPAPTITINDPTAAEATGAIAFTITLSQSVGADVTVDYALIDGSAVVADIGGGPEDGSLDYGAATDDDASTTDGTATIVAGKTAAVVTVVINDDSEIENDETFVLKLSNPNGVTWTGYPTISTLDGLATITNDDNSSISIVDKTVVEGDSGIQTVYFTVTQSPSNVADASVNYTTAGVTASNAGDYTATSGTLTFLAGSTLKTIPVVIAGDTVDEGTGAETFTLTIDTPVNTTIDTSANGNVSGNASIATGTITDDDAQPTITIDNQTVTEGASGATVNAGFTVTLSNGTEVGDVTMTFDTADNTATSVSSDYVSQSAQTLTIAASTPGTVNTTGAITIVVNGDDTDEGDSSDDGDSDTETFDVNLTTGSDTVNTLVFTDASGRVTITDDDDPAVVSVADVTVTEGADGATVVATYTISLTPASGKAVSVDYATAANTAVSTDTDADGHADGDSDFVAASGSKTFTVGQNDLTVDVTIVGDDVDETSTETYAFNLTNPTNATLGSSATGTITDDDASPTVSIADQTVTEGASATTAATFTVSLDHESDTDITVDYVTGDGTATESGAAASGGADYDALASTTLTILAGTTSSTFDVTVNGDTTDEATETFTATLSGETGGVGGTGVTLGTAVGTGTITTDDTAPTITIASPTAEAETGGPAMEFTVSLSNTSDGAITVDYATADGADGDTTLNAAAGSDYTSQSGTVTFAAGASSDAVTIAVPLTDDSTDEEDQSFTVTLTAASETGGTNGSAAIDGANDTGTGTITDDDDPPTVTISAPSATAEADSGTTSFVFTVDLSAASEKTITMQADSADNTATASGADPAVGDVDYTAVVAGALSFAALDTQETVTVTVNGDTTEENDETFDVDLTSLVNVTASTTSATATITNDDATPSIAVDNPTAVTEGAEGASSTQTFTISLSNPTALGAVTLDHATDDGAATSADPDYTAIPTTQTSFAIGETSATVAVTVLGDDKDEDTSEAYTLQLSNASGGSITDGSGTGTITDDDDPPTISIDSPTAVTEGADGTSTSIAFTVTLSNPSKNTVTANYATADVDATSSNASVTGDADYDAAASTVSFAEEVLTQTITIAVNGDDVDEGASQTFTVDLSNPANGSLATDGTDSGTGTITDDEVTPTVAIADVTVGAEGAASTSQTASPALTLTGISEFTLTADYATTDGTATTADGDYTAATGTASFAPGDTTETVDLAVTVAGDDRDEFDETITVTLSNPSAELSLGTSTATITVTDDDDPPTVSVSSETLGVEGASTTEADMTFTVSLDAVSGKSITMDYATTDGTATTAGGDYSTASASLTFAAGDTSKSVVVTANGDDLDEEDEAYTLDVSSIVNGLNTTATGTGTITDDDDPPTVSIGDALVTEGDVDTTVGVAVSLSGASGKSITVDYTTSDDTATTADGDYTADGPTTLTYAAGETLKTITLTIGGDTKDEDNESFDVLLSGESNVTVLDDTGVVSINDNDAPPTVSTVDVSVTEGTSESTATATVTATLSEVSGKAITIQTDTSDGTATTADFDYAAITAGSISIAAGSLSGTADVYVSGDITDEGTDEALTLTLSNGSNVTIDSGSDNGNASGADNVATVTITDDDDPPVISVVDASVTEGSSATLTVSFSNPSALQVDVDYATDDGTATTADSDYTSVSATTLSFAAGETSQDVTIDSTSDTTDEVDETLTVTLSNPSNGTLDTGDDLGNAASADNVATVTITNDDNPPSVYISDPAASDEDSAGSLAFTVTLSNASSSDVTVNYASADDTATTGGASAAGGADYTATSGTLTISAGSTTESTTVAVPVGVDTTDESDETFTVTLTSPGGGSSGTPTLDAGTNTPGNTSGSGSVATATITDDDDSPTVQVADISVTEDDAISTTGTLTVALSNTSDQAITVDYATADGTALTAGDDYTTAGGTVTFAAGSSSDTFDVTVRGDFKDEDDETFTAVLSGPVNATLDSGTDLGNASGANSTATVTILDNDALPTVSIANPATTGEPSTPTTVNFTVTLSAVSGRAVTVDYATADGTAEDENGGGDYVADTATLTFTEGETVKSIPITVNGDSLDEDDESFSVTLSNETNSTIDTATATLTISDNDDEPTLSIDSPTVDEDTAGAATFTATLDNASGRELTVDYTTADDTATAPDDYTAASGTLTFAAGETTQTFDVTVVADTTDEDDETVAVTLSGGVNVQLASASATLTITDDDDQPNISFGDITVTEGSSQDTVSPTTASFVVTLDAASGKAVDVTYATADGTATEADGDYTAASGTLTLAAGELTSSVDVSVGADYDDEPDETFVLSISAVTNATASVMSATATIADDDEPPLTVTAPTSASDGQDVTFSAEIVLPISTATSASLFYTEGGDTSFTESILTNTTANTWTATVPGSDVTMRGLVWYLELIDDLDGGRTFSENDFGSPGYVPVNGSVDLSLSTMVTSPNIWNGVAPAVSPDSTSMSTTFDTTDGGFITEWFAWRWDAADQQWEIAESLGDGTPVASDGFETGKGWFVAAIGDGTSETRSVTGQSVDPTSRAALPIVAGWNLLANPFNFSVAWSDATILASVLNQEASPTFHKLNNNSAVDNRLIYLDTSSQSYVSRASNESTGYSVPAGQAFWFLSAQSGELLIPASESTSGSSAAPAALKAKGEWRIYVTATSEAGADEAQAIAARDAKIEDDGALSFVKAPSFPGSDVPRVTLLNPELDGYMSRVTQDMQTIGDEMVWLLDVANGDGAVLSWRTVDVPADYDLQLVDLTSERVIDLRQDSRIRLEGSGFNSRQYALKAVKRIIPEVTRLLPNYPNPFNPETWIPFELSEESEVDITIYGMRGQVIRRLELGRMREGAYVTREQAAYWDGRNDLGERVASAVYIYEIRAGEHVERRRMLVLK
jgi:hypothetical protein